MITDNNRWLAVAPSVCVSALSHFRFRLLLLLLLSYLL